MLRAFYISLVVSLIFFSCGEEYTPEQKEYIKKIKSIREDKNKEFQSAPYSPFVQDAAAHFSPLKYYPVNPDFVFVSKLTEYQPKDSVIVLGTKGEERKVIKYGFLTFNHKGKDYRLNVYQGKSKSGEEYHSVWFTDLTTGEETYGVGRYIDFEVNPDKNFDYTIDFNLAYNPYCAYSSKYSCAVPTKDDFLDMKVLAGEKIFHE